MNRQISRTVGESLTCGVYQRLGRGLCALGGGGICLCFLELLSVGGSVGVGLARCLARLPTLERRTTCTANRTPQACQSGTLARVQECLRQTLQPAGLARHSLCSGQLSDWGLSLFG